MNNRLVDALLSKTRNKQHTYNSDDSSVTFLYQWFSIFLLCEFCVSLELKFHNDVLSATVLGHFLASINFCFDCNLFCVCL